MGTYACGRPQTVKCAYVAGSLRATRSKMCIRTMSSSGRWPHFTDSLYGPAEDLRTVRIAHPPLPSGWPSTTPWRLEPGFQPTRSAPIATQRSFTGVTSPIVHRERLPESAPSVFAQARSRPSATAQHNDACQIDVSSE